MGIELFDQLVVEQSVDALTMHQIGANEPREGKWALDCVLGSLSETQQHEGNEGNGNLDAHGVFGGAEEALDLQGLLDPAKEQLDGPAALVEIGDLLRGGIEVVAQQAQHFGARSTLLLG